MNSLRQECKERLKVAFDSIRVVSNTVNFILIVDNYGLKVLSNTIKMMELINYGITIVERLELQRKRYSKIEAVYLISPKSFQKLMEDFPDGQRPQYKSIHILSISKMSQSDMNTLADEPNIAKRIKTLKQINFGFSLHSHNEVKLCNYEENSFQASLDKDHQFINSSIEELSSILTTLSSFYVVEIFYQKPNSNNLAEKVALGLKQRIESLFKSFEKNAVPNYNSSANLTTFLILDRSYDSVSPLIRDYHYGPLFYDIKNIKNHKVTEFGKDKKVLTLNDNDEIFEKYKNMHIGAALKGIPADFDDFSQSHAAAKFHKGGQQGDLDMNKLTQVMKKMPQYMDIKDRYVLHYETLEEIMRNMKEKQLQDQGFVEQSLLSLTNDDGKKLKEKDALTNLIKKLEKTEDQKERAKLVLIGIMCLDIKSKDQGMLTKFLSKKYEGIEKNVQKLQGMSVCRLNPKKQQKGNEILDRHEPKLEDIVRQISNQSHGDLKLLRVGAGDKASKSMAKSHMGVGLKKIKVKEDKKEKPRLIVFLNSAIGYNEMRSISQYENMYHIIFVSHNFVTPNQYLEKINEYQGGEEMEL